MNEHGQQQYDFGEEDFKGERSAALLNNLAASEPAQLEKRIGRRKLLISAGIAGGGLLVAGVAGYKILGYLAPPPQLFQLIGPLTTAQDIVIYTKAQLSENWQNWSWTDNDLDSQTQ